MRPESILEVGIGNGFTSTFLRKAGFAVTTVDINCALDPDICASIAEMKSKLAGKQFDLLVCCEVLEHMPFHSFEASLAVFRSISPRLYLTLPSYKRVFGFGGFLRVPFAGVMKTSLMLDFPTKKTLDKEHFWEVGSSSETNLVSIRKILCEYYEEVAIFRYFLNPYHIAFRAES